MNMICDGRIVDTTTESRAIIVNGRLEKQIRDINGTSTKNFIEWHISELKRMKNILMTIGRYDGLETTLLHRIALRFKI